MAQELKVDSVLMDYNVFFKKMDQNFVDEINAEEFIVRVKKATVKQLDPHSHFYTKEESISRIRVLVQDMNPKKRSLAGAGPQLNITLVDMNQTKITQKGKGSNNKKMDWEKNFSKMKGDQGVMI